MNYSKKAGETRTFLVDFSGKLEGAVIPCGWTPDWPPLTGAIEALSGTPTVVELSSADLTISGVAINTAARTFSSFVYPANHGVEFTVSGGVARTDYTLRVSVTTDASPQQTLIEDIRLRVL